MVDNYPFSLGSHTQQIVPSFVNDLPKSNIEMEPSSQTKEFEPLSQAQANAYKLINESSGSVILHGITGSGKTRIYAELAKDAINNNHNILILYPEISLTTQLETSLTEYFGADKIAVFHSKLTPKQRLSTWQRVHNAKKGLITIGPRSALFLPHTNLGFVIIDEAHDGAYKQDTGSRYNSLMVAASLSNIHGAKLLLGSATPPVQETAMILNKGGVLVCLHELAVQNTKTTKSYELIDMTDRNNISSSSNHLLSKRLVEAVEESLKNKLLSLLFLNKRGTARLLYCETCGWHAKCPNRNDHLHHEERHHHASGHHQGREVGQVRGFRQGRSREVSGASAPK